MLRDADGRPVVDEAWGEFLLDVRTAAKRKALARIVGRWVRGCARHGYAAVEYDNLDSFTRSDGLLTKRQAIRYAALLVDRAHRHGLAAGQKNLAGFDGTTIGYDFAVSEECGRYDECQRYVDDFGDQVLMIEYRAEDFAETCTAYGATHAVELRDRDLTPSRRARVVLMLAHDRAGGRGRAGSRVVFCHGLFGQGRNFTAIGKALADEHRVTLVDMPDHGRSPWSDHFDYLAAADQVAELLSIADDPVALVGHSMGGKIAMLVALRHPELVERLVVVDVAPVPYDHATEFDGYITAMRAIDLDTLQRRSEAEDALREAVPNPTVRGFLLQSLRRERRPLAVAPQPRAARPRPRRHHRLARGRAGRHRAVRRAGAVGRRRRLGVRPRRTTSRRWTAGSRATGGSRSRAPGTGCTASSPRCSSRCCAVPRSLDPA